MEQIESQPNQIVGLRPRTGIPEGGLSSEPVKRKGIVGRLGQFARRVLANVNTEKPSGKAF